MEKYVVVRYGEISLKGRNRNLFEEKLVGNIKACLDKNRIKYEKITRPYGRILIKSRGNCGCLRDVFGIISFSKAVAVGLDLDEIKKEALKLFRKGTFRVSAQRLSKVFMTSQEINEKIGEWVVKKKKAKVNLKKPRTEIGIEIINDKAYLFNSKVKGLGGLPVGISGLVSVLLEDKNGIEAGKLMMKRGCKLEVIKKKNISIKELEKHSYGEEIKIVKKPSENSEAVVVSDSLENMKKRRYKLPILYPMLCSEFKI